MKYKSLESLRGIAAVCVALFHSQFISGEKNPVIAQGDIFVDFFFILSGFVMAFAYTDKIKANLNFKEFILLRFGRLYPLHLFTLFVFLAYTVSKAFAYYKFNMGNDPFIENNVFTFISNLFLVNSLGINGSLSWNRPAWSISVEFFTYIAFYLLVFALKNKLRTWHVFICFTLAYLCLYFLTDKYLLSTYKFGIFRCLGGFFLGVFVFNFSKKSSVSLTTIKASFLEISILVTALFFVAFSQESKIFQLGAISLLALVVFVFSIQDQGLISKFLQLKYMLLLGALSYSIYMTHFIVFSVLGNIWQFILKMPKTLIEREGKHVLIYFDTSYAALINLFALVVIIALSYITYHYIEQPWRKKFRALA